jgi:transcription-repair coupling factor (superfamily II helicase)
MVESGWLDRAADEPGMRDRIKRWHANHDVVWLSHVAPPAFAFVAAVLARHRRSGGNLWILCGDVRHQEALDAEWEWWTGERALFFPALPRQAGWDLLPDPDVIAERTSVIQKIAAGEAGHIILLLESDWDAEVPKMGSLVKDSFEVTKGARLAPESLVKRLEESGFEMADQVVRRGQYARRGGILDVFGWQMEHPLRMEWFDDEVESLRHFDVHTQTSLGRVTEARILLRLPENKREFCQVGSLPGQSDVIIALEPSGETIPSAVRLVITSGPEPEADSEDRSVAFYEKPLGEWRAGDFVVREARRKEFLDQSARWVAEGWEVQLVFHNDGERDRFRELVPDSDGRSWREVTGPLNRGFSFPAGGLVLLAAAELFGRYQHMRTARLGAIERKTPMARARAVVAELETGGLVVHVDHGIAKYRGLEKRQTPDGREEEVLTLEFANEAFLYVPLSHARLVSRYVGPGGIKPPALNKLGDPRWGKARKAAEKAIATYAERLLRVAAERETLEGIAHPPDTSWQWEFENSFLYKETPDQLRAISEVKADMEAPRPMDRLLCGDVGFGKTEVAIRAIFKAVMGGRQAAILVPTTVLAQQHFENFRERFSDYPVRVELISRFVPPARQREIVEGLFNGSVDVVVGTHRLTSKDVIFKNLGLVVIDEEQRFGVEHKEKFRDRFRTVDVLTLSATPIPRTLYLSLMGARDLSTLETPPLNRHAVETTVCAYDERVIGAAIQREVARGGQVYFLHNRVQSIEQVASRVTFLCPGVRAAIGHGQMKENELEDVMHRFVNGSVDVLVCTTIIESGVDIPNANTILIDRADMFGLADLYQLRGRVGRADRKAHAILLLPRHVLSTGTARKRLNAIQQYSSLGSGFRIAMRDLEIRGVGNLLGTEQSGHMFQIGFDLYCQLLKTAVARLTGKQGARVIDVVFRADFLVRDEAEFLRRNASPKLLPAFIPTAYIPNPEQRLQAYREIAEVGGATELKELVRNWRDRFGVFPEPVDHLLRITEIKLVAARKGIDTVEISSDKLMIQRKGGFVQIDGKFPRLTVAGPKPKIQLALKLLQSL